MLSSLTTVAVMELAPSVEPSVHLVDATPFCPVVAALTDTAPPPPVTANLTITPAAGPPARFVATTRIESLTTAPGLAALGGVHRNGATSTALATSTLTPIGREITPRADAV